MNQRLGWFGAIFGLLAAGSLAGCQRTAVKFEVPSTAWEDDKDSAKPTPLLRRSPHQLVATGIRDDRELFKAWAKPDFVICLTGRQNGYIEPCGCTGLANQNGGLARRHTLYKQLDAKGWPMLKLDVGNLIRRFGVQPALKFQATVDALRKQEYDAVAFGPDDLRLSLGDVIASVAPVGDGPSLFVSANASVADMNAKYRVFEVAGKRIGVTGFLGKGEQKNIQNPDIQLADPVESLKPIAAELQEQQCDVLILLACPP